MMVYEMVTPSFFRTLAERTMSFSGERIVALTLEAAGWQQRRNPKCSVHESWVDDNLIEKAGPDFGVVSVDTQIGKRVLEPLEQTKNLPEFPPMPRKVELSPKAKAALAEAADKDPLPPVLDMAKALQKRFSERA